MAKKPRTFLPFLVGLTFSASAAYASPTIYVMGPTGPLQEVFANATTQTVCTSSGTASGTLALNKMKAKAVASAGGTTSTQTCTQQTTTTYDKVWLHPDYQGSVHLVTKPDGSPALTTTYKPYGEPLSKTGGYAESLSYTGQRQDSSTGLFYLHARYYDPALSRFISPDPITPGKEIVKLNHYAYADNDPVNKTDVSGMQGEEKKDPSSDLGRTTLDFSVGTNRERGVVLGIQLTFDSPKALFTSPLFPGPTVAALGNLMTPLATAPAVPYVIMNETPGLEYLDTAVHEGSHALASLVLGGGYEKIEFNPESGAAGMFTGEKALEGWKHTAMLAAPYAVDTGKLLGLTALARSGSLDFGSKNTTFGNAMGALAGLSVGASLLNYVINSQGSTSDIARISQNTGIDKNILTTAGTALNFGIGCLFYCAMARK
ncbi:MAG: M50 family metallopeptidase [Pseudomonadota bacterium]